MPETKEKGRTYTVSFCTEWHSHRQFNSGRDYGSLREDKKAWRSLEKTQKANKKNSEKSKSTVERSKSSVAGNSPKLEPIDEEIAGPSSATVPVDTERAIIVPNSDVNSCLGEEFVFYQTPVYELCFS